jgi:elongation factor G
VAIFSAVEGVQPQSESVWRQADRYGVPRICFINKMDRIGADYRSTLQQIKERLQARPVLLQLPIGAEGDFAGVIDLLSEEALLFDHSDLGSTVRREPLSPAAAEETEEARLLLIEAAADFDDGVMADFLDGKRVTEERLRSALRQGTLAGALFPVLLGAALRNKGIQPLLDAIGLYLPSPLEIRPRTGHNPDTGKEETLACDPAAPLRALAFKVMAEEGRRLTYLRIYSGTLHNGTTLLNSTRRSAERIRRLFRMHSHKREELAEAQAGDIVAALGCQETLTGDTLCDPDRPLLLEGLTIPEPVVSLAVEAKRTEDRERLPLGLEQLSWEDPTFRVHEDAETGQTILTGMGELHLEIIIDRLGREYGVQVRTGRPRVVYRETLRQEVERREVFHREGERRPESAEVVLRLTPLPRGSGVSMVLPLAEAPLTPELLAAVEESLQQGCRSGCRTGYPLTDLEVQLREIFLEAGLPSEPVLRAAARRGLFLAARESESLLLEPIMALELEVPPENLGKVLGTLQQKRGRVEGMEQRGNREVVRATVPLAEMFGYMTELRSATRGRGSYTMEFLRFEEAPLGIQEQFGLA